MSLEIETTVLTGPDGKVIGISLVAGAETYSEDFIGRFPRAFMRGEATIAIDGEEIVFEGPTFSGDKRTFRFRPEPAALAGLKANVFTESVKKAFEPDGMMTPGFKIVVRQ